METDTQSLLPLEHDDCGAISLDDGSGGWQPLQDHVSPTEGKLTPSVGEELAAANTNQGVESEAQSEIDESQDNPDNMRLDGGGGMPAMMDVSKCYAIVILVLAFLLNCKWASFESHATNNPMLAMEGLYTYLYITSIIILTIFYFFKKKTLGETRKLGQSCISKATLFLTYALGSVSIIYCLVEFVTYLDAFPHTNLFVIAQINSCLAAIMIVLEMIFLTKYKVTGDICNSNTPGYLSGLQRLAKMHLFITHMSIWIKIGAKESVVYTLEYREKTNNTYDIPTITNPRQAYKCFNTTETACAGKMTLWTLEQAFSYSPVHDLFSTEHFGTNFFPAFSAFCTVMMCVFYEMFTKLDTNQHPEVDQEQPPRPDQRSGECETEPSHTSSTPPYQGFIAGLLPVAVVLAFWSVKQEAMTQWILYLILTVLYLAPTIVTRFITAKASFSRHDLLAIDRNILFITLIGLILYVMSCTLAFINMDTSQYNNYNEQVRNGNIVTSLVSCFACVLQVNLVCNLPGKSTRQQDGRSLKYKIMCNLLNFIAMVNLAIWIQDTFLLSQSFSSFTIQIEYWSFSWWVIIWRIAQPLCSFFRVQSFILTISYLLTMFRV